MNAKTSSGKERLKEGRGKGQLTYKGRHISVVPDFLTEILKGKR